MVYPEFELYKARYLSLQEQFNVILTEKERLITKTMPSAITYDKDKTSASPSDNPLEDYVISLEEKQIDIKLDKIGTLLELRKKLLECKEQELRLSPDKYDRIYKYRFIEGMGVKKISRIMGYSRAQIYKDLEKIKKNKT